MGLRIIGFVFMFCVFVLVSCCSRCDGLSEKFVFVWNFGMM